MIDYISLIKLHNTKNEKVFIVESSDEEDKKYPITVISLKKNALIYTSDYQRYELKARKNLDTPDLIVKLLLESCVITPEESDGEYVFLIDDKSWNSREFTQ